MQTLDLIEKNWKKQASAAAVDKGSLEKAFMDQAYVFIANKCGPLMKDPYRLGFEIVYKNEKDDRLVGIFAFRVNRELFYAPCFFLSGDIKGTDLLYRHKTKMFSPNTEEWAEYWVENVDTAEGKGVDRSETAKLPSNVAVDKLAFPPYSNGAGFKSAAVIADPAEVSREEAREGAREKAREDAREKARIAFRKAKGPVFKAASSSDEAWEEFFKEAEAQKPIRKGILAELVAEEGGVAVLEKLAAAIESSYSFADALMANVDVTALVPQAVKKASAPSPELYSVSELTPGMTKSAADALFNDGFFFYDARPQEAMTVVYSAANESLEMITLAGEAEVLCADGDLRPAFLAPIQEDMMQFSDDDLRPTCCSSSENEQHFSPLMAVVFEDRRTATSRNVMGNPKEALAINAKIPGEGNSSFVLDSMSERKAYRLFDRKLGVLSDPYYVLSKKTRSGITIYDVVAHHGGRAKTIRQNPDYTGGMKDGVFGENIGFVEVKVKDVQDEGGYCHFTEDTTSLAGSGDLEKWIMGHKHIKKATISMKEGEYHISLDGVTSPAMDKKEAMTMLTAALEIKSATAHQMLGDVHATRKGTFHLQFAKEAGSYGVRINKVPNFRTDSNAEFGVAMEVPQSFRLSSETQKDEPMDNRVGDAWDPSSGNGIRSGGTEKLTHLPDSVLESATPDQIAQLSKSQNMPNVFEHGAVSSMVKTFDSAAIIDKYIPKLVEALDAQGRILFLFYWKPKDFQESYGVDDMAELENDLTSNFQSFGALTLTLIKQSRKKRPGSVSMN